MACADRRLARPFVVALAVVLAALLAACGDGVQEADGDLTSTAPPVNQPSADEPGDTAITTTSEAAPSDTTEADTPDAPDTSAGDGDAPVAEPPGDLGDDDELNALADDCFAGDFSACDRLFFESDVDSAYEAYGDSCGGRNEPAGLCVTIYGPG